MVIAARLVDELGEAAVRISKVRLVELLAADNRRAAAFWEDVMRSAERLLANRPATAPSGSPAPPPARAEDRTP